MPRPIEPIDPNTGFKTVTIKLAGPDWHRVRAEIKRRKQKTGYKITIQDLLRELVGTLPEVGECLKDQK